MRPMSVAHGESARNFLVRPPLLCAQCDSCSEHDVQARCPNRVEADEDINNKLIGNSIIGAFIAANSALQSTGVDLR
jgi:hypothetical protein